MHTKIGLGENGYNRILSLVFEVCHSNGPNCVYVLLFNNQKFLALNI